MQKKKPWQHADVQAEERHMNRFICTSCTAPAKSHCEKCLKTEPEALKNPDWENLKFFILYITTLQPIKRAHKSSFYTAYKKKNIVFKFFKYTFFSINVYIYKKK